MQRYIEIQNDAIRRYNIDLCDGTKCKDGDWGRMHAHIKGRRICKWVQKNSAHCTFELLHEIGHIENNYSGMRRFEEEYAATVWAVARCAEYGVEIPKKTRDSYDRYIHMEYDRGIRRGAKHMLEKKVEWE